MGKSNEYFSYDQPGVGLFQQVPSKWADYSPNHVHWASDQLDQTYTWAHTSTILKDLQQALVTYETTTGGKPTKIIMSPMGFGALGTHIVSVSYTTASPNPTIFGIPVEVNYKINKHNFVFKSEAPPFEVNKYTYKVYSNNDISVAPFNSNAGSISFQVKWENPKHDIKQDIIDAQKMIAGLALVEESPSGTYRSTVEGELHVEHDAPYDDIHAAQILAKITKAPAVYVICNKCKTPTYIQSIITKTSPEYDGAKYTVRVAHVKDFKCSHWIPDEALEL